MQGRARERGSERSSICHFTTKLAMKARADPGRSQAPRALSGSHTRVSRTKAWIHLPMTFSRQSRQHLNSHLNIMGYQHHSSSLIHQSTTLAPICFSFFPSPYKRHSDTEKWTEAESYSHLLVHHPEAFNCQSRARLNAEAQVLLIGGWNRTTYALAVS